MTEKNNNDDEYQFSELDGNQVFDDSSDSSPIKTRAPSENNLKKFIILGVSALIVIFIGYKFVLTLFSSSKNSNNAQKKIVKKAEQPVVKPVVKAKPKVVQQIQPKEDFYTQPKVETITKTVSDPAMKAKLNALENSSEQTVQKVNRINSTLGSFTKALNGLNSKLTSINANVAMMAQEIQNQQAYIDKLKAKALAKKVKIKKTNFKPRKIYSIQAIIPGRAWLISNKGDTITVVEGTMIPRYGRVSIIDPQQGQITLASGKVIQFKASDT